MDPQIQTEDFFLNLGAPPGPRLDTLQGDFDDI